MLTLTKQEYEDIKDSSEATLMAKAKAVKDRLKSGYDISDSAVALSVAYCNLLAIENYMTGDFNPEEYFNVSSPNDVSRSFSRINSVDIGFKKK